MITPAQERLLVRRNAVEEKTPGGVFKPEGAQEKPQTGVVLAVGPGKYLVTQFLRYQSDFAVGDTVYFGKYAGTEIEVDNETLLILNDNDILGKETK
jgi:chaperonin GroES